MNVLIRKGLENLAAQKPNTASRAAIGGMLGGVLGAMIFGPIGAAIGAAVLAGYGAHSGAVEDERSAS
ncbi:hypothetical protein ACFLSZ_05910 [Candidatus Bipolaricaulota bacterium]